MRAGLPIVWEREYLHGATEDGSPLFVDPKTGEAWPELPTLHSDGLPV